MNRSVRFAFIDVDGVLSAPVYADEKNNEYCIGFSDEDWSRYLEDEGVYAYRYCAPVPQMKRFVAGLKERGIMPFVLSSVMNETEKQAKIVFLDRHYKDLFREYFFVRKDTDKIAFIRKFASLNEIDMQQCLLVDDTYDLLLKAHLEGITCAHLANVLAGNISS